MILINVNFQNSQLIQIQVRNQSQTIYHYSHMQNMINENQQQLILLKRKHKLYKVFTQQIIYPHIDDQSSKNNIISLYEFIINKQHQIHQINYYIKHQFQCNVQKYSKILIELIWKIQSYRSNHIISFIYYRLSRKYPILYWNIHQFIQYKILKNDNKNQQQICILTDLFMYGFPITQQEFLQKILPQFKNFIIQMIPKYLVTLINDEILNIKAHKIIKIRFQQWLQTKKIQIKEHFQQLKQKSKKLQNKIMKNICSQQQEIQYENQLQDFETLVYHFMLASNMLNISFQKQLYQLKSIFQLKKQCLTFKSNFDASQYEKQLYLSHNEQLKQIKSVKKSQITVLKYHQAYTNQVKLCLTIAQCIKLIGYFIQQLNIQNNRQQLIELIINECYYYDNISYIIKILSEINHLQPHIKQYCQIKGRNICNQNRMNQKYQKILCQMCRFGILDDNILLDYCQKILKYQNISVSKEIQSILQQLGSIVYYRSLQTHIKINTLFERMQAIIKNKMMQFNVQNLLQLKSIWNFLKNPKNNKAQSQITKIQIKQNFKFIYKKMQKLLKNKQYTTIDEYLSQGINQQQFLNVYYYSSLIKQLNSKQLNQIIYNRTISQIFLNISLGNLQNGIKWSRFLGQLYSYLIINRKKIIQALNLILNKTEQNNSLNNKIKFIGAALNISKQYLLQSQKNNQNKIVIVFLFQLKKTIVQNQCLQMITQCQIDDIMDYFHPYLSKIKNLQEIKLIQGMQFTQSKNNSFYNNLYYYFDLLNSGFDVKQIINKSSSTVKYIEKPIIKYKQKNSPVKDLQGTKDNERQSQQSHKTSQTVQKSNKKMMKVMGRDKNTNTIKITTCSYSLESI